MRPSWTREMGERVFDGCMDGEQSSSSYEKVEDRWCWKQSRPGCPSPKPRPSRLVDPSARLSLLKSRPTRGICILRADPLFGRHGQMARNPLWDTEERCSHAPRVGVGEPGTAPATRGVEGAPATPATDRDGSNLLGSAVELWEESATPLARDWSAEAQPQITRQTAM